MPHFDYRRYSEVEKFSDNGRLKVVVIRTVADITHLTVKEVQEADVVIAATSVLRSPLYFERLSRLAGASSLPPCKVWRCWLTPC